MFDIGRNKYNLLCRICHYGAYDYDDIYVELLLKYGADPTKKLVKLGLPISGCVNRFQHGLPKTLNILKLLLEYGTDVNAIPKMLNHATYGNQKG
jgi:hypothetical protein